MAELFKYVTVKLSRKEIDYVEDALDLLANYRSNEESDSVGGKLIEAWNDGEMCHRQSPRKHGKGSGDK